MIHAIVLSVMGLCDSGDECQLGELHFTKPFKTDAYVCTGNQLLLDGGEAYDTALEFYPQTRYHVLVQFPNDTDDDIPNGTKIRIAYTCKE